MKKYFFTVFVLLLIHGPLSMVYGQTYVWKNGQPLVTDPDSITFVQPDMSAQVISSEKTEGDYTEIHFRYPTQDYLGRPVWMSAQLLLESAQVASKHIGKMAMYSHYTIARLDECPSAGQSDMQKLVLSRHFAIVSADYEGFGETGDRWQAYCFGEANARASIDALLAAREWLVKEGYTLSDTIINYGYSQGAQTAVAAIKLSQSEYRGKVRFMKNFAGGGPYDLRLTFCKFLEYGEIDQPAVLPMTIITINELRNYGLNYADVFKAPLANNVKSWFISKKFSTKEIRELFGSDRISDFIQPAYTDSTSVEISAVLKEVDQYNLTTGWVPDADTDIKLFHSLNDGLVAPENSKQMYDFFVSNGVTNAVLDTTTLTLKHLDSGVSFALQMVMELMSW